MAGWRGSLLFLAGVVAMCGLHLAPQQANAKRAPQLRGVMLSPNWDRAAPYGASQADQANEIAAACALGANLVRLVVNWPILEPARKAFNPTYVARVDQILAGAQACGARAVLTLMSTPCWASTAAPCWRSPPRKASLYGAAVKWVLRRWGDQLAAFEVWNEPNQEHFWRGSAARYVRLVKAAGRAADKTRSSVKILAGALAGPDTGYLRRLYRRGLRGHDGISIHPYNMKTAGAGAGFADPAARGAAAGAGSRAFRLGVPEVRRVMRQRHERRKRIWLTEFGFAACPASPLCVSEASQADWLVKSFQLAARWRYVRGLTVFSLRDTGPTSEWDYRFGLLRRDFSPRPSYWALQATLPTLPP